MILKYDYFKLVINVSLFNLSDLQEDLVELIRWAKSLDNGQVGGEKGGSTTFSMKTSKLFSPNAWGKIPGAFHPPRQPDIKHMNLHPIFFFLAGGEVTNSAYSWECQRSRTLF